MAEAAPSSAECWTMIAQFSEIVWDEWANARGNFLSNIDVVQQALEGSIALQASPSMDAMRASYAALIDGAADGLDFLFRELARSYKLTTVGGTATLSALYHYQAQQGTPVTLESRAPTRAGSATAGGSNIGNGVFYITNVDQYGYVIEDMVGAVTDLRCTSDQATGTASGSEVFTAKLTGTVPTDSLSLPSGGEITETFTSLLNGGGILSNPSFDANKATGSVTGDGSKFTGWLSSGANANVTYTDTATEYYVISPGRRLVTSGAAHGRAAKFTGADSVYQQLTGVDENACHAAIIRYRFASSGGGIVGRVGSVYASAAYADTNWKNLVIFPISAGDSNGYYRQFQSASGPTSFEVYTKSGTTEIEVDDIIFETSGYFNGRYTTIASGTTPWRAKTGGTNDLDSATMADTLPSSVGTGVIQTVINKAFPAALPDWPGYMPHDPTPNIADP